jgi:transcriptional regulator GlxA family with amidase domain
VSVSSESFAVASRRSSAHPPAGPAPAVAAPAIAARDRPPRSFAFALIDAFSMMSVCSAIEPLRAANRLLGREVYRWTLLSADGRPVRASNGMLVGVDGPLAAPTEAELVFVCAGLHANARPQQAFAVALRRTLRRGGAIGAISAGAFVLARAGLLDGHRCTIHWEYRPAFVERHPQIACTHALFEIDRQRYTCAGGVASMDLMLSLIARDQGPGLAQAVANQFQLERIRSTRDAQRSGAVGYLDDAPPALRQAVATMLAEIEDPLPIPEVAQRVGLTPRQVERLFAHHIGQSPVRYYLGLRLDRARELLLHTDLPVLDVAVATGFTTASHFAQCYRARYGITPTVARQRAAVGA